MLASQPSRRMEKAIGPSVQVLGWLREKIHRRGRLLGPVELVTSAVGHAPTEAPLLAYLEEKYGALHGV